MITIPLELTEAQLKQLTEDAEQQGLTLQELASLRVLLVPLPSGPGAGVDFESAAEYVFDKNSELYERLA